MRKIQNERLPNPSRGARDVMNTLTSIERGFAYAEIVEMAVAAPDMTFTVALAQGMLDDAIREDRVRTARRISGGQQ